MSRRSVILSKALVIEGVALFAGGVIAQEEAVETPVDFEEASAGAFAKEALIEVPEVEELGENRYRLGAFEFDAATRIITFDATVELDGENKEEYLEYVIVNSRGSTHESLLSTEGRVFDLQIVLRLLKYRAFRGTLFDNFARESGEGGPDAPITPAGETAAGSRPPESDLRILISWPGKEPMPIADAILDKRSAGAMKEAPFRFVGALPPGKYYKPQNETAMVGIYLDPHCMLNFLGDGNRDDSIWFPRKGHIPLKGSSVTVSIEPVTQLLEPNAS